MVYTVTVNPSLDYVVEVQDFKTGIVNRSFCEKIFAGGKGINVATVLHSLEIPVIALGFVAGFTGNQICKMLDEQGLPNSFVKVQNGNSRINVKLKSKEETEINGQGPFISDQNIAQLKNQLDSLNQNDFLVLAGSTPPCLPKTFYVDIIKELHSKKIKIVVDATKDLLTNVLTFEPFLVKPNVHELSEIFNCKIESKEQVAFYAKKLQEMGAKNVLVSMAQDGAVLLTQNKELYKSNCPQGKKINSVGAGDSMVAGFIAGFIKTNNYIEAFKTSLCAGSASAFSEELATKNQIEQLLNKTKFDFITL